MRWLSRLLLTVALTFSVSPSLAQTGPRGLPNSKGNNASPGPGNRGAWNASTAYRKGDQVTSGNNLYTATGTNVNSRPPSRNWTLLNKGTTRPQGPDGSDRITFIDACAAPYHADPTGAADSTVAIQAAIDSLIDATGLAGGPNGKPGGFVFLRDGTYKISRPLWVDSDRVGIKGQSQGGTIIQPRNAFPAIMVAHKRQMNWNRGIGHLATIPSVFAADHWVDTFNKLDSSFSNSPGVRFGFTSKSPSSGSPYPDHWVSCLYSAPNFGGTSTDHPFGAMNSRQIDCWEFCNKLTIDFAFEVPGGSLQGPMFGFGDQHHPQPWWLQFRGDSYILAFNADKANAQTNPPTCRVFTFSSPPPKGLQKVSIQVDFTANNAAGLCPLRAWINGVEQAITRTHPNYGCQLTKPSATEPSFTAADNLHFASSAPCRIFSFFNTGHSAADWDGTIAPANRGNYILYGWHLSDTTRYTSTGGKTVNGDTSGGRQVRIDGGTLNDAYRYLGTGEATQHSICYLNTDFHHFTSPPLNGTESKYVPFTAPLVASGYVFYGFFMAGNQEGTGASVVTNHFSDFTIQGGGSGILLGQALHPKFERLTIYGRTDAFMVGIGGTVGSVYDVLIRDCKIANCSIAWIAEFGWLVTIERLGRADATGKYVLHCDQGEVVCRDLLIGGCALCEDVIKITATEFPYGSHFHFDGISIDNEGDSYPTDAVIRCEALATPVGTELHVRRLDTQVLFSYVPTIKLLDAGQNPGVSPGKLILEDTAQTGPLVVQTDGPAWSGRFEGSGDFGGNTRWRAHNGTDGTGNVVSFHTMEQLPAGGAWLKNAHEITIRRPAPGAARKYICTTSGVGTWSASVGYVAPWQMAPLLGFTYSNGTIYKCIKTNGPGTAAGVSQPPSANWLAVGNWNPNTSYTYGDCVISGGNLWVARSPNTNKLPALADTTTPLGGRVYAWDLLCPAGQAMWSPVETLGTPTAGP